MRWRDADGERQSNARFVTWSDGSVQLLVGDTVRRVISPSERACRPHVCTPSGGR
jgi:hypothetical protein